MTKILKMKQVVIRWATNLLFFLGLPFIGFSQQTINGSINHDGQQRDYILYVPESYTGDSPVPLIFNFHGYSNTAGLQMRYGDFRSIADTAGFIIVHPQGTLLRGITHWNVGGWTVGSTTDDVGFTEALISFIASEYNVDLARVYATGMSNGGYMSFLLACQLSNKIAAIASVTGSMTPEIFNDCNPQHPTPVLQIHGTTDAVVPYYGANWTKPIDKVMEYWVNYNNCSLTAATTTLPNINVIDGSIVEHIVYDGGDNNSTAEHFKVKGGGHTWPGTALVGPGTNYDFDASAEIWKFFSRYDLNGLREATNIEPLGENHLRLKIYPNPTHSLVSIEFETLQEVNYHLLSLTGEIVLSGTIHSSQYDINLLGLPRGVYVLRIGNRGYKIVKTE